ncbi:MAG: DMT family transporter [Anaerolineaceae bacterium]
MGELAAMAAAMVWSATSVALTSLSARTAPAVLSALRLAFGSFVLLVLLIFSGQISDLREASAIQLFGVVVSGMVGYGLGDTLYIAALARLGMQRTFPVTMALYIGLTVVAGVILLDEPFTWGLPAGTMLIGAGVFLVVVGPRSSHVSHVPVAESALAAMGEIPEPPRSPAPSGGADYVGYALLLLVGIFWAVATIWLAGSKGDLGAIAAGAIRTPAGAVSLLAFCAASQRPALARPFGDRRHIGAIIVAGVVGTGLGSLMFVYAVVHAGAARTAVLSATAPLLAVPLSMIFLGERFTVRIGTGTALCVVGIVLVVI